MKNARTTSCCTNGTHEHTRTSHYITMSIINNGRIKCVFRVRSCQPSLRFGRRGEGKVEYSCTRRRRRRRRVLTTCEGIYHIGSNQFCTCMFFFLYFPASSCWGFFLPPRAGAFSCLLVLGLCMDMESDLHLRFGNGGGILGTAFWDRVAFLIAGWHKRTSAFWGTSCYQSSAFCICICYGCWLDTVVPSKRKTPLSGTWHGLLQPKFRGC
ncbi:hypothetical protein B0H65DRAFT_98585 [Neurospora tetraspora]|uniref:Uncharacterized protein n=1 Tax=Neurospora tetraspora TaxID=94610 RepID=A0AAE0MUA6_9PEZI|nr:hypothetical protein B0H65DRAFT_98585 [Neurospora tetraspora]